MAKKDLIQYWLEIWYFKEEDNYVFVNPDNKISFKEFEFEYNTFITNKKKDVKSA